MKYLKITLLLLFITVCFAGGGAAVSTPEADGKKEIQTVISTVPKNFHRVNQNIFRSGQPEAEEFAALYKSHKLRSVLNLRRWHSDRRKIAAANRELPAPLSLYEIRLNAGKISENDLIDILTVIRDAPKPLLIHCWHGSDRTGCAVAASRIVFENWSVENAIAELMKEEYGHHKEIYPNIPALLRKADWQKIKRIISKKEI